MSDEKMEVLKPCPFCGGSPTYYSTIGLECSDCDALMPIDDYGLIKSETDKHNGCVKAWNARAEDSK